eukprot:scpid75473/ scgid13996/ 
MSRSEEAHSAACTDTTDHPAGLQALHRPKTSSSSSLNFTIGAGGASLGSAIPQFLQADEAAAVAAVAQPRNQVKHVVDKASWPDSPHETLLKATTAGVRQLRNQASPKCHDVPVTIPSTSAAAAAPAGFRHSGGGDRQEPRGFTFGRQHPPNSGAVDTSLPLTSQLLRDLLPTPIAAESLESPASETGDSCEPMTGVERRTTTTSTSTSPSSRRHRAAAVPIMLSSADDDDGVAAGAAPMNRRGVGMKDVVGYPAVADSMLDSGYVEAASLPLPVVGLEQALKSFHQHVNDLLVERKANLSENRGQLNMMTSLLEDVMDLQGKIAAKKVEMSQSMLPHPVSVALPRNSQLASKMVTKYHQQLCRLPVARHAVVDEADGLSLMPGTITPRTCTPGSVCSDVDDDDEPVELPPFILDIESLQDCSCVAAEPANLTSADLEEVLDHCHRRLYHNPPDLSLDNLLDASCQPARHTTDKSERIVLDVMSRLMPIINDERRYTASLFSVVIEMMRILCEEHETNKRHVREIQQEHATEFERMENNMSRQIVQLLRVIEKQEAEVRRLRQPSIKDSCSCGRAAQLLTSSPQAGGKLPIGYDSVTSSSMPNIHDSLESLTCTLHTQPEKHALRRSSSLTSVSMALPITALPAAHSHDEEQQQSSGEKDVFDSPSRSVPASSHWLTKAMAWLQPVTETDA